MPSIKMVTVTIGDQKKIMTPEDALNFAYGIIQQAIEAAGGAKDGLQPKFGDLVMETPSITVRVEPNDDGPNSVAIVARSKRRPDVWLWFDEKDAASIGATLLNLPAAQTGSGH